MTPDVLSRVSLVIPVRNEAESLPRLWRTIQNQTRDPDEIVFVDGQSTDDTLLLLNELAAEDPRVRVVAAGPATPGRGRNIGIARATHDWIALTDAGIELDANWLEELVQVARQYPTARAVYGTYEPMTRTFYERCAALAYSGVLRDTPVGKMRGPSIASVLLHRSVWETVGGFSDLRSSEDLMFFEAVEEAAIPIRWAPRARIRWELTRSLAETYRRFRLYSTNAVLAGLHRGWHVPMARKYLVAAPFVVLAIRSSRYWLAFPLAGGCARVAASIWRRREGRSLAWACSPVQFAGVAAVVFTIDVATFDGWIRALVQRSRARRESSVPLRPPLLVPMPGQDGAQSDKAQSDMAHQRKAGG